MWSPNHPNVPLREPSRALVVASVHTPKFLIPHGSGTLFHFLSQPLSTSAAARRAAHDLRPFCYGGARRVRPTFRPRPTTRSAPSSPPTTALPGAPLAQLVYLRAPPATPAAPKAAPLALTRARHPSNGGGHPPRHGLVLGKGHASTDTRAPLASCGSVSCVSPLRNFSKPHPRTPSHDGSQAPSA